MRGVRGERRKAIDFKLEEPEREREISCALGACEVSAMTHNGIY